MKKLLKPNIKKNGIRRLLSIALAITAFFMTIPISQANAQNSSAILLGKPNDFERTGKVLLVNPEAWDSNARDGEIAYRKLKQRAAADIYFVAFEVDANGFCNNDAILEILYRDDILKWKDEGKHRFQGDVIIRSRIDFTDSNQYFEVGSLNSTGDGKWKVATIFLEKTLRQMIRAIDGSFQLKLLMPSSETAGLPISYIKLRMVTHKELVTLRELDRVKRELKRIEYEPNVLDNKLPTQIPKSGFVTYPVNYLELVFPASPVKYDHIGEGLKCFEVAGEAEPVTFVIHTFVDLEEVHVTVSDLQSEDDIILNKNIDIRRVIYNDQRWGWNAERYYGTCPDYLSFLNPIVDLKSNSNCQFWLTINVPPDARPGIYRGKVTVQAKNKDTQAMPLYVEVLPIKLLTNKIKHVIYHCPYGRKFDKDPVTVFTDMKKHHIVPIFELPLWKDFENQLRTFRKVYPETKELFLNLSDYYGAWRSLKGPNPEFQRPFPEFNAKYGKVLKKYADLGKRYGLEFYFTFNDEPFKYADRRRPSYLCSLIAQAEGLKTWSTHSLSDDVQLQLTEDEIKSNINYLRPLREVLDVFVEGVTRINDNSIKTFQNDRPNLSYYTTYLATSVRPVYNRLLHGIYPFVTKSKFVVCYAYYDENVDPYDDMDRRANYPYEVGTNDYLLIYPTWQGDILPTLSYEALREGIEDSQLISTLQNLTQYALRADQVDVRKLGEEARDYLNELFGKLSKNFDKDYWQKHKALPVDPMVEAILKDLNSGRYADYGGFDDVRRHVCELIIKLQNCGEVERKAQLFN
jgi:hypothetical protein